MSLKLNLGCSDTKIEGLIGVDIVQPCDLIADLTQKWPWEDDSVEFVLARDIFEHLPNRIHTMNELHRVLEPGGEAEVAVPTTEGAGAFSDPTHISFWNRRSFNYYLDGSPYRERLARSYGITACFALMSEKTIVTADGPHLTVILRAVK